MRERDREREEGRKEHVYSATSAMTAMHPAMTAAFGCAPLIPPSPEDTNTFPARSSVPRYFLPAFSTVICKTGIV